MTLKDIATIAGKPGLYKVLTPARASIIVESLDDKKAKVVATAQQRISILDEISIYTTTTEGSVPLQDIFEKIHREFGADPGVDKKSEADELQAFLQHVLPEYDAKRVYASDIKKLVSWYHILLHQAPGVFSGETDEEE